MGGSVGIPGLAHVEWGTATADSLAGTSAPVPGRRRPARSAGTACWPTARYADRWSDVVQLLTGSAVSTRRAALGWPAVQPDGPRSWNAAALSRCDAALDDLLARGLTPAVTLFHMDLPAWAEAAGGWMARGTASWFGDFAGAMGDRFGDRVARWVTMTDLYAPSLADHVAGMVPPGRRSRGLTGLASVHHVLLGHGLATLALRERGVRGQIGTTAVLFGGYPATSDPWDRLAVEEFETLGNGLFLDPLLLGRHFGPGDGTPWVERAGCVRPGDLEVISAPVDLLGLSWHEACRIAAPENLPLLFPAGGGFRALNEVNRLIAPLGFVQAPFDDVETNRFGWPIIPEGLADALASLHGRYGAALPPLHIIDNGMGDLHLGDDADDLDRYRLLLQRRLSWLAPAVADGVDIRWYEYWSVLDNLSWKAAYARLYQRSVCSGDAEGLPAAPREWAGPAAVDLLAPPPLPAGLSAARGLASLRLHHA